MSKKTAYIQAKKFLQSGDDFNCAETLLHAANAAYDLGLDSKALKTMAGFGGGLYHEKMCGAVSGAVAALSVMFTETVAHESERLEKIITDYFETFNSAFQTTNCYHLKENYRSEADGCTSIVLKAAQIFDETVKKHSRK